MVTRRNLGEHSRVGISRWICLLFLGAGLSHLAGAPARHLDLLSLTPATNEFLRVYGPAGNDGRYGVPVFGGQDVDGDGFRDFGFSHLVTDPSGRENAGSVSVVFGTGGIGGGNNSYDIVGSAIVDTAKFNGHFNFHYDENLGVNGPRTAFVVTSWREI